MLQPPRFCPKRFANHLFQVSLTSDTEKRRKMMQNGGVHSQIRNLLAEHGSPLVATSVAFPVPVSGPKSGPNLKSYAWTLAVPRATRKPRNTQSTSAKLPSRQHLARLHKRHNSGTPPRHFPMLPAIPHCPPNTCHGQSSAAPPHRQRSHIPARSGRQLRRQSTKDISSEEVWPTRAPRCPAAATIAARGINDGRAPVLNQ